MPTLSQIHPLVRAVHPTAVAEKPSTSKACPKAGPLTEIVAELEFVMRSVTGIVFGEPDAPLAKTVIVVEYEPAGSPVVPTETVTGAFPLPDVGAVLSQFASSDTDQDSVPMPVFEIENVCAAGVELTGVAKLKLVGETERIGDPGPAVTVSVTGIVFGEPDAPLAETVIVAPYEPAGSPAVETETVADAFPLPDVGVALSQVALSDTDHDSVPLPVFEIESVCADGFAPAVAENVRLEGETESVAVAVRRSMVKIFEELVDCCKHTSK